MPFKDTKKGTTHYENDGCGEPAHNPMSTKTPQEERAEEIMNIVNNGISKAIQEGTLIISHGNISHPLKESSTCEDCITNDKQFKEAKESGELDRILGKTHKENLREEWNRYISPEDVADLSVRKHVADWFLSRTIPTASLIEMKEKMEGEITPLQGKGGHGNCCMCLDCKNYHEECTCSKIDSIKFGIQLLTQLIEENK